MRAKITKRVLDSLKAPSSGEIKVWDTELRGFVVRVRAGGSRRFIVEWKREGESRRVTLGEYGALTADQAREMARQILARVARGEDPAAERALAKAAPTLADLAQRYLEQHANLKKKHSSCLGDERNLRLHVVPVLGRRKVTEITLKHIADLHASMSGKPVQANRMLALLSKMFNLAERWGMRPSGSNPCRGIDRFPESRRERFLSAAEIARLGEVLERSAPTEPFVVLAIRLLLLTGARRDEILTLRWSEVDFERTCLRLSDSKTGAKVIPLGPAAVSLLAQAPRVEANPYVIPGRRAEGRLTGIHRPWVRIRESAGLGELRLHDLRHSFASIGAAAGLGLPILGAILGHQSHVTTARYAHLDDDPRLQAAARISGKIAESLWRQPGAE